MTKEEAINVYEEIINPKIREAFETLVPELQPDEDEKLRRNLIEIVKQNYPKDDVSNYINWLEKRKAKNRSNCGYTDVLNAIRTVYNKKSAEELCDYFKKSIEKLHEYNTGTLKTWKPSREQMHALRMVASGANIAHYQGDLFALKEELEKLV